MAHHRQDAPSPPPVGLVDDPLYLEHRPSPGHPERAERLLAVRRGIAAAAPAERLCALTPRPAAEEDLRLVHSPDYLRVVERDVAQGEGVLSTGDTDLSARSLEAARLAAGGVLAAVDAVAAGRVRRAFCAVRPPGHHASADRGMGFCIFNNVALAARWAQRRHGAQRVLIADWDVHHGNGTQAIFYADPSVFFFSTHQWPAYPGTGAAGETGAGAGRGFTLNCPFAPGAGGREIVSAFRERLLPAMRRFQPDFVLVSAGFDSRAGDPLGRFTLSDDDFAELTRLLIGVAEEYAGGRLVSVLEGGYALDGLASAAGAHVAALAQPNAG